MSFVNQSSIYTEVICLLPLSHITRMDCILTVYMMPSYFNIFAKTQKTRLSKHVYSLLFAKSKQASTLQTVPLESWTVPRQGVEFRKGTIGAVAHLQAKGTFNPICVGAHTGIDTGSIGPSTAIAKGNDTDLDGNSIRRCVGGVGNVGDIGGIHSRIVAYHRHNGSSRIATTRIFARAGCSQHIVLHKQVVVGVLDDGIGLGFHGNLQQDLGGRSPLPNGTKAHDDQVLTVEGYRSIGIKGYEGSIHDGLVQYQQRHVVQQSPTRVAIQWMGNLLTYAVYCTVSTGPCCINTDISKESQTMCGGQDGLRMNQTATARRTRCPGIGDKPRKGTG